jgi:hypothetical protein
MTQLFSIDDFDEKRDDNKDELLLSKEPSCEVEE